MNIQKILAGAATGAILFLVTANSAFAAAPTWQLNAPNPLNFVCGGGTYAHALDTVVENPTTGDFTGTGNYTADPSYTWNITGNTTGNAITFQVVYTGTNAGYTLNGVGTIAPDGSISGSVDGNCETFNMPAGTATAIIVVSPSPTSKDQCKNNGWMTFTNPTFKNQGDCVSFVQSNPHAIANKTK